MRNRHPDEGRPVEDQGDVATPGTAVNPDGASMICRLDGCGNKTSAEHGYCLIHRSVGESPSRLGTVDASDLPLVPPDDDDEVVDAALGIRVGPAIEFQCLSCGSTYGAQSMEEMPTLRVDAPEVEVDTTLCPRCAHAVAEFSEGRAVIYLDDEGVTDGRAVIYLDSEGTRSNV